jgi:hypothetical protein
VTICFYFFAKINKTKPEEMAKRLPALAFLAAFLVSFNVFGNFRDAHLPTLNTRPRVDPLTQSTAGLLARGGGGGGNGNEVDTSAVAFARAGGAEVRSTTAATVSDVTGIAIGGGDSGNNEAASEDATAATARAAAAAAAAAAAGHAAAAGATFGSKPSGGAAAAASADPHPFQPKEHTEFGGDVVKWGETHLTKDARACYESCLALVDAKLTCNIWAGLALPGVRLVTSTYWLSSTGVLTAKCREKRQSYIWVYCGVKGGCTGNQPYKACWLKHQPRPDNPVGPADATNPWTSGSMVPPVDTSVGGCTAVECTCPIALKALCFQPSIACKRA